MSQEAEILSLLYRGQREAFESRLQQFRRLQLSQSKVGKGKLCRLINNVVRADGQYATVLIEDLSNMLNDSDAVVRNDAITAFSKSAHLFLFHIVLARALYPESDVAKDALADLQCALSLAQHEAAGTDAFDYRFETASSGVPEMVHMAAKTPIAKGMRIIMMQLAFFAQIGVDPSKTDDSAGSTHDDGPGTKSEDAPVTASENKEMYVNHNFTDDKWLRIITSDRSLLSQLSQWSRDALKFMSACICAAIRSDKSFVVKRSLLAAEVASVLVARYPYQYFSILAKPLIATYTHLSKTVKEYEPMILRIFTSDAAAEFHMELAGMLNEVGYHCPLSELYKRAHATAATNRSYVYEVDKDVVEDDAINLVSMLMNTKDTDELFHLATQSPGERPPDSELARIKAAQIIEYDPVAMQHMSTSTEHFYCPAAELRLSHAKGPEEGPNVSAEPEVNSNYFMPKTEVQLVPTTCDSIREHHQLYSQLVATQMMDTVISYTWHLRRSVLPIIRSYRFKPFNQRLFNKLFLSGVIPRATQLELFSELVDHLAQMTLIDIACYPAKRVPNMNQEVNTALNPLAVALADAKNAGVSELLAHVATQRHSTALESLLECVNDILMSRASVELARGVLEGRTKECINTLIMAPGAIEQATIKVECTTENDERATYAELVNIAIEKLYRSRVLEIVEIRDAYVLQICRFILNMPYIPLTIVDLIRTWLSNKTSRRLAFSLVSNILKKWHCPILKEQILVIFLRALVSDDAEVKPLFLRLISSQKGIYHASSDGKRYSIASLEAVHDSMLEWIRRGGGCTKCNLEPNLSEDIIRDCNYMANRPFWQWPSGLVKQIDKAHDVESSTKKGRCKEHEWSTFTSALSRVPTDESSEAPDWKLMPSVWLEEIFAFLVKPGSVSIHPFVEGIAKRLLEENPDTLVVDPLITATWKNGSLVSLICDIAGELDEAALKQAKRSCCMHIAEVVHFLRYRPQEDKFMVELLSDIRAMWLDPKCQLMDIWRQEPSPAKELVEVALGHLESCDVYAMQMVPFMAVDQLEKIVTHLFVHGSEESLKGVLSFMLEVPPTFKREQKDLNFALPHHFMYYCYNIKPDKELLKKQTGLLDHCVECCVRGQLSVQSALAACTLIVESTEEVSFVFGRVLCQLVQKVVQTRSVVVQSILPALFQREAWSEKMLWRGVVICMSTLWPTNKEQLCRLLLLLPQEQGEATIKTLQAQHNVIAFMESTLPQLDHSVHIPRYIKDMLAL